MQFYKIYNQSNQKEVEALVQRSKYGLLHTLSAQKNIHVGVFNPIWMGNRFYLHLHTKDEQVVDLRSTGNALITFLDFHALIPSYWLEPDYAGAATAYYCYAEFDCESRVLENPKDMIPILEKMMCHYQPEKGYAPMSEGASIYQQAFRRIVIVELQPKQIRTKWKLGQNRTLAERHNVVGQLRDRGGVGDINAIEEMKKWMRA